MSFYLSKAVNLSKVFVTKKSGLASRWDPNYYRCMAIFRERVKGCAFPIERLKPSLALVQYGISERATEEPVGVPMLRMINLQADSWDISDLKYIKMTEKAKNLYLMQQGDLLFNRTNSKELVGKCNVFDIHGEYVFASYLIRVRLRPGTLLPDYVTAFLSSSIGRMQIDAVSRQIAGMTNINAEEIRDLEIPILDEAAQGKVVKEWQAAIRKRDQTLDKARKMLGSIDDVLLDELGIKLQLERPNTIENRIIRTSFKRLTGQRWDPTYFHEKFDTNLKSVVGGKYECQLLHTMISFLESGSRPTGGVKSIEQGILSFGGEHINAFGEIDLKNRRYIPIDYHAEHRYTETRKDDILIVKDGATTGKIGILKEHEHVGQNVNEHIFILRTGEEIRPDYIFNFLYSMVGQRLLNREITGATVTGLTKPVIRKLPIPKPPPDVQARLCGCIAAIRQKAAALRTKAFEEFDSAKRDIEILILGHEESM